MTNEAGADVDRHGTVRLGWASGVLLLVAVALVCGPIGSLSLAGRDLVVSWIDLVAIGAVVVGWVRLRRTGTGWRLDDPAVGAYVAFLTLVAVQVLVPFVGEVGDGEILTGASRFAGPVALLVGLTWLRRSGEPTPGWRWREALTLLGLLVAAGILVDAVSAIGDPGIEGFYDWKRAIQQPLGVSNILTAYTAFAFWPSVALALEDRRWLPAPIALGLATAVVMSRGAALGMAVAAVVVFVGWRWSARLAVAGLVAVTLALTVVPIAMDTDAGADGLLSSAVRVRDEQFTAAWEAWQEAPMLGVGLNRFQEEVIVETSGNSAAAVDGVIPYEHPNNAWLMALAEVGLLGAAIYLVLWVLLARRIVAMPDTVHKAAAAAAVAGLAVHSQLEALTFTRGVEILLALMLGALGPASNLRRSPPVSTP